jgi:mannose-6-phosphate isomerase-like protein (cupin superfamily)
MSKYLTKSKINLKSKLELIKDYWSPKVVAELNDYQFKLAKIKDEFIWHQHNDTDEAFMVIEGNIEIELEDSTVELSEGEMFIVPKGAKHKPIARGEAHIMLIEPRDVKNTGDFENELTAKNDIWI